MTAPPPERQRASYRRGRPGDKQSRAGQTPRFSSQAAVLAPPASQRARPIHRPMGCNRSGQRQGSAPPPGSIVGPREPPSLVIRGFDRPARPVSADDASVDDYELIDAGGGARLERFGPYVVERPHPAAFDARRSTERWRDADLRFEREGGWSGPGLDEARSDGAFGWTIWSLKHARPILDTSACSPSTPRCCPGFSSRRPTAETPVRPQPLRLHRTRHARPGPRRRGRRPRRRRPPDRRLGAPKRGAERPRGSTDPLARR